MLLDNRYVTLPKLIPQTLPQLTFEFPLKHCLSILKTRPFKPSLFIPRAENTQ